MASGQYNYPPPPPPPSQQSGPPNGYQSYSPTSYGQQQLRGGPPPSRGRSGYNARGRGDFQSAPPQIHHYGPPPPQASNGYGQQSPSPYIGPQVPSVSSTAGYPPPSWGQPQGPPVQMQHQAAPAPAPLSAQNYHPNYAPQVYQQPQPQAQQYGPQQPPYQQSHAPNTYGHQAPHPQTQHGNGPPQQWQGPSQGHQAYESSNSNRGRGRGGPVQTQGRGNFNAPLMGPPIRMGFDSERLGDQRSPPGNSYPPPYAPPSMHTSPPGPPFSSPAYSGGGYPPPPSSTSNRGHSGRSELPPNPYHSRGSGDHRGEHRNGRGGMHGRGRGGRDDRDGRDRRDNRFNDRDRHSRFGKDRDHRHGNGDRSSTHNNTAKLPQIAVPKAGEGKKKKKKKRKTNTLGLTPATEEHIESEEEDDADEEAKLAERVANMELPDAPKIDDLGAWLAERRSNFPTKARREAKEAELVKRRALAAEQSARDKAKAKKEKEEAAAATVQKVDKESKLEKQKRKADKLRKQLEIAEQKVQDAMKAGMKRKRDENDSGDDENTVKQDGDLVDQVIAKVTANGDSDSDSDDSSEFTDASDSDEPDEQTSARTGPTKILPPSKKPILERHCKYFSTGGTCGKKGKCRFIHDQSVRDAALREKELNGGRMTLSQRLIQNDQAKDELVLVKSLKYLNSIGILDDNGMSVEQSSGAVQNSPDTVMQDGNEV